MNSGAPLHERIAAASLTPSEAQVAAFMAANPGLVAVSSTAELGSYTSTSDATVVRTSKKLGYGNFRELRHSALAISGRHRDPSKVLDHQLAQITGGSPGLHIVLRDTARVLAQLEDDLDENAWEQAVSTLAGAKRVITFGVGPSGCPAEYLGIRLGRTGVPTMTVTATGLRLADALLDMRSDDVVVLFATLRRFREIDAIVDHARDTGAKTIVVSETLGEALRSRVDVVLSTPQTTTGTSDGVLIGMVLAHALNLSVAARDQVAAVKSMERLNALRGGVVGEWLDVEG
jgi:DNA-binding MurR/RpiR family transcriptional regulator